MTVLKRAVFNCSCVRTKTDFVHTFHRRARRAPQSAILEAKRAMADAHVIHQNQPKRKRKRSTVVTSVDANPLRTEVVDARRTYSQLLLNTFNSCDMAKLHKTFHTYCTPNVYSVCNYEGVINPYASNKIETRSIDQHLALWNALTKSAPDFFFDGQFLEAYICNASEDQRCVVRSKFTMRGTRIVDIKVANIVNEQVIKQKLECKDNVRTCIMYHVITH